MTVSSLWKALDRAGCGRPVGANELQDHHQIKAKTNPWNYNEVKNSDEVRRGPVLAVDLSIWICEALTSLAMQQNHVADPALQLVYSRTMKLLNLGIRLVVVIEGKRRIRRRQPRIDGEDDVVVGTKADPTPENKFRKRRSGSRFWSACQRCEELLQLLGVPVVRAKAEGEALCALLNEKGIVDGVISNDGDCFLFGAKVLYTKFSVENLDQSKVMRYDASTIRAFVDDDDSDKYDDTRQTLKDGHEVVNLSRNDLIAFAILTGSDLAGDGLSKVGCRKAIRFIRKCQIDNPLKLGGETGASPALNELIKWESMAATATTEAVAAISTNNITTSCGAPRCSCCGHAGTKKDHKKHGCETCGTAPGEPCFQLSQGGRFRKSIRSKALEMGSRFDPSYTCGAYHQPNDNQIPLILVGKSAQTIQMDTPRLQELLQSSFLVRASATESREFIRKTVSMYLARTEIRHRMATPMQNQHDCSSKLPTNRTRPVPLRINKLLVRAGKSLCEVQWLVKATVTDAEGNPIDEFEFTTIEDDHVMRRCYPKVFEAFDAQEREKKHQGASEQDKRSAFLRSLFDPSAKEVVIRTVPQQETGAALKEEDKEKKKKRLRDVFFEKDCAPDRTKQQVKAKGKSDDVNNLVVDMAYVLSRAAKKETDKKPERHIRAPQEKDKSFLEISNRIGCGDDVAKILFRDEVGTLTNSGEESTIATCSMTPILDNAHDCPRDADLAYFGKTMTPGHICFLGDPKSDKKEREKSPIGKCIAWSDDWQSAFLGVYKGVPSNINEDKHHSEQVSTRRCQGENEAVVTAEGSNCVNVAQYKFKLHEQPKTVSGPMFNVRREDDVFDEHALVELPLGRMDEEDIFIRNDFCRQFLQTSVPKRQRTYEAPAVKPAFMLKDRRNDDDRATEIYESPFGTNQVCRSKHVYDTLQSDDLFDGDPNLAGQHIGDPQVDLFEHSMCDYSRQRLDNSTKEELLFRGSRNGFLLRVPERDPVEDGIFGHPSGDNFHSESRVDTCPLEYQAHEDDMQDRKDFWPRDEVVESYDKVECFESAGLGTCSQHHSHGTSDIGKVTVDCSFLNDIEVYPERSTFYADRRQDANEENEWSEGLDMTRPQIQQNCADSSDPYVSSKSNFSVRRYDDEIEFDGSYNGKTVFRNDNCGHQHFGFMNRHDEVTYCDPSNNCKRDDLFHGGAETQCEVGDQLWRTEYPDEERDLRCRDKGQIRRTQSGQATTHYDDDRNEKEIELDKRTEMKLRALNRQAQTGAICEKFLAGYRPSSDIPSISVL